MFFFHNPTSFLIHHGRRTSSYHQSITTYSELFCSADVWNKSPDFSASGVTSENSLHLDKKCWVVHFLFQMITPESPWRWRTAKATPITSTPARLWVPPLLSNSAFHTRAPTAPMGHNRNKSSLPLSNVNFDVMLALLRRQPHRMRMFPSMNINDRYTANTPGENLLREDLRKDMHMTCFSFVKLKLICGVLGNDCFWPWVMLIWHYFVFTVTMRLACCGYLLARCRF